MHAVETLHSKRVIFGIAADSYSLENAQITSSYTNDLNLIPVELYHIVCLKRFYFQSFFFGSGEFLSYSLLLMIFCLF